MRIDIIYIYTCTYDTLYTYCILWTGNQFSSDKPISRSISMLYHTTQYIKCRCLASFYSILLCYTTAGSEDDTVMQIL